MHPDVPGFKLLKNERYAISTDGRIWHKSYQGGWQAVEPYQFCTGEMVIRFYRENGGMAVYTVESVLAGHPRLPSGLT